MKNVIASVTFAAVVALGYLTVEGVYGLLIGDENDITRSLVWVVSKIGGASDGN